MPFDGIVFAERLLRVEQAPAAAQRGRDDHRDCPQAHLALSIAPIESDRINAR
jgi:hypothetical protein